MFIAQAGQYTNDVTVFLKIRRSTIKTLPECISCYSAQDSVSLILGRFFFRPKKSFFDRPVELFVRRISWSACSHGYHVRDRKEVSKEEPSAEISKTKWRLDSTKRFYVKTVDVLPVSHEGCSA